MPFPMQVEPLPFPEPPSPYSFKLTMKKAASELGLVVAAAVAVALSKAFMDPASAGLELPQSEMGVLATAVLAAVGRALANMAKHLGK
jgi:hypothetical protein